MKRLIFLFFLVHFFTSLFASDSLSVKRLGVLPITIYDQSQYDFSAHNFDVLIGDDQKIYFANNSGVLIFDGTLWTQVTLPNATSAYSLAKSTNGTIYVGGINEIGYLKPNIRGIMQYHSLHEELGIQSGSSFRARTWANGEQVMVTTGSETYLISDDQSIRHIEGPGACSIQISNGKSYAFCGRDQYQLIGDEWQFVQVSPFIDGSQFGSGSILDIQGQTLVVNQEGIFDFESGNALTISTELRSFLSTSRIYRASALNNQFIAICTFEGLIITDTQGQLLSFLNKETGLSDNFLYRAVLDKHGMLWIATYNGITKIDLMSSYSLLDKRLGIQGVIKDVQLHKDQLYFSSIDGIYRTKWNSVQNLLSKPRFDKVSDYVCHQMINTGDDLFAYTERQNNIYLNRHGEFDDILGTESTIYWAGFKYSETDDLMLASFDGQLIHVRKENGRWVVVNRMDPEFLAAEFMVEGADQDIWLSSVTEGVFKMGYDRESMTLLSDIKYGKEHGLPSNLNNNVYLIGGKPCFATEGGIYRFDPSTEHFLLDKQFAKSIGEVPVTMISEDRLGNIYYFSDEFVMLKKMGDRFEKIRFPNIDFRKYPPSDITVVDPQNIFISSNDAIIHIDPSQSSMVNETQARISKLATLDSDSVVFGGFGNPADIVLPTSQNDLRFHFSSDYYKDDQQTRFKWRLKGLNEEWSEWSGEHYRDLTNLPSGNYVFEVMARNAAGVESKSDSISFSIAIPWYLSIWSYLGYCMIFVLLVWVIVKLNTKRLIAEKKQLESIVQERTQVISLQKEQVEEQHQKLLEADDLKKRFFVNISHELRTPLTLSMGTVDQALKGTYGELNQELYNSLKISKRNNERLLKMVTSILDISKLEGGRIQLHSAQVDPVITIRKVLAFFASRFDDKKISLKTNLTEGLKCFLDEDKFETILINLVSNAFKFTPEGGTISVSVSEIDNHIAIKVEDSGPGIPESDTSLVFDRFYQSPTIKSGEGIGVGLALVKELVELHHGVISAGNNDGALFTIHFLMGSDHLTENEISDKSDIGALRSLEDKYPLQDPIPLPSEHHPEIQTGSEHILLVEDNQEMSQFVSDLLSPIYQISKAYDGAEALEFLKLEKPDLIITDYLMPNMDGYEMASEIKKHKELAHIPIIFLTARAREQDKLNVLNLGVDDYLFKPFSQEELLIRIKNLLYTRKQREDFLLEEQIDPEDIEWKEFPSKLKTTVEAYLETHIKNEITADQLAEFTNQSERTLYRKIKANTGLSLMGYVKEYRLRKARMLLENGAFQTVSEVSYAVGFNYLSHFTKSYKERFGKPPSAYLE